MPDAQITDAQRDLMFDRLGVLLGFALDAQRLELFYHPKNTDKYLTRMIHGDETQTKVTGLLITRAKVDTDTSVNSVVYVTLTDGGGGTGHTAIFYSDQARTVTVATMAATDDDNTGTIVPGVGFFLAGTIDLGTVVGNEDFSFYVSPAPIDRIGDEFDGTELEDPTIRNEAESIVAGLHTAFRNARRRWESLISLLLLGDGTRGGTFKRIISFSSDDVLLSNGLSPNNAGGIVRQPSGFLETLRLAMQDNTAGSGAIILEQNANTPTVAFGGTWAGRSAGVQLDDRAVAGNILFTCIKTLDGTAPRFRAVHTPTDPRKELGVNYDQTQLEFELTIGQVWRSQRAGVPSLKIDYAPVIVNTVNTPLDTTSTLWSVDGLTTGNSTSGEVFAVFDGTDLKFYDNSTNRDAGGTDGLIATASAPGVASAFVATGDAGITISGTTGAALANGDKGEVDFVVPVPTSPADFFTLATAVSAEPGLFQRLIGRGAAGGQPWYLHSDTPANVVDAQVVAGSLTAGFKSYGDAP